MLRMKKVGHTGTLDPDVDGVLPICLGNATKIAEYITDAGKVYEGEVTIGFSTDTEDASGEIVDVKKIDHDITTDEINQILNSLTGEIQQTPPMFSAVKVKGKRLYEYARAGITIERPSRTVTIYELVMLDEPVKSHEGQLAFRFRVHCSKGTYIRTLAVMMGEKLGYPAHMSKLTRIASASFTAAQCVTFSQIESKIETNTISDIIYPLEAGITHLPLFELNEETAKRVKNGSVLNKPANWPGEQVVMSYQEQAIAIYHIHPEKESMIKPVKVLRNE